MTIKQIKLKGQGSLQNYNLSHQPKTLIETVKDEIRDAHDPTRHDWHYTEWATLEGKPIFEMVGSDGACMLSRNPGRTTAWDIALTIYGAECLEVKRVNIGLKDLSRWVKNDIGFTPSA